MISMDDYFVDREHTPRDANGEYDFECLDAVDVPFFNEQLAALLDGQEVEVPRFDFQTGTRQTAGQRMQLGPSDVLIIEGIHALNPDLTPSIPDTLKYRLYVSALTTIQLDDERRISTSDNRLIRRIIRDYKFRGYSASETIHRWPSVRAGEEKWIFPFQENADRMVNSALLYELAVLRGYVMPLLEEVPVDSPDYDEALRLRSLVGFFEPIPTKQIPPVSLLREFLGGSSFKY
jgi:uridine kinase